MIYTTLSFLFNILIYILIILALHYLWDYLKDNYSKKKTKDIISIQTSKYKQIINEINNNNVNSTKTNLDTNEVEKLNSDLESFFNNQLSESIN
tara:strand:- start:2123 stop:2404 length:282 start_codon:yes stop_codon:yes gene_type:complete